MAPLVKIKAFTHLYQVLKIVTFLQIGFALTPLAIAVLLHNRPKELTLLKTDGCLKVAFKTAIRFYLVLESKINASLISSIKPTESISGRGGADENTFPSLLINNK